MSWMRQEIGEQPDAVAVPSLPAMVAVSDPLIDSHRSPGRAAQAAGACRHRRSPSRRERCPGRWAQHRRRRMRRRACPKSDHDSRSEHLYSGI